MKYFIWVLCIAMTAMACNSDSTSETAQANEKPTTTKTTQAKATKDGVNWLTIDEAQKMAQKSPKKMIVDVYTYWCGPCKMMDRQTFSNPEVAQLMNDKFYPVKFNAESPDEINFNGESFKNPGYKPDVPKNRRNSAHQFVRKLAIRGYPTLVVIDENMNIQHSIVGFKKPDQLLAELKNL